MELIRGFIISQQRQRISVQEVTEDQYLLIFNNLYYHHRVCDKLN